MALAHPPGSSSCTFPQSHPLSHLFNKDAYSDVTIKYGDRFFKGHKNILCKPAGYFEKLFGHESKFAEAKQAVVELKDDDPDSLEALFRSIYTFKYVDNAEKRGKDWKYHLDYSVTAKKYDFEEQSTEGLSAAKTIIADMHDPLKIVHMMSVIPDYESHDPSLIDACDKVIKHNLVALLATEEFRSMLLTDTDKLWDLMAHLTSPRPNVRETELTTCSMSKCHNLILREQFQCAFHRIGSVKLTLPKKCWVQQEQPPSDVKAES